MGSAFKETESCVRLIGSRDHVNGSFLCLQPVLFLMVGVEDFDILILMVDAEK